jgi:hypothetical protein
LARARRALLEKTRNSRRARILLSPAAMRRERFESVLRHALWIALAACGGRAGSDLESNSSPEDAATSPDAGTEPDGAIVDTGVRDVRLTDGSSPEAGVCATIEGPPDARVVSCSYELTLVDPDACEWSEVRNEGSQAQCSKLCGNNVFYCQRVGTKVECMSGCVGRLPAGLARDQNQGHSALALYFARAAQLEAASVDAFRIAKSELVALGAPRALVRACGRAARDEVRHARVSRALARRFGGRAGSTRVAPSSRRTLEQIATENAIEGCVRETFGALIAMYQASQARDPGVRAAMRRIARDEAEHARLAWRIAHFANTRLSRAERARVRSAREHAARQLEREVRVASPAALADAAGLPSAELASQMVAALASSLWAA